LGINGKNEILFQIQNMPTDCEAYLRATVRKKKLKKIYCFNTGFDSLYKPPSL